jgi:hypothetical protein
MPSCGRRGATPAADTTKATEAIPLTRGTGARPGTWGTLAAIAAVIASAHCSVAEAPSGAHGAAEADAAPAVDDGTPDSSASPTPASGDDAGASPDASASTGMAGPCGGLPLCDDFESAAAGGPPSTKLWSLSQPDCTGTGTLAVDDAQAHGGKHSLRVDGGGGYCDHVFIANTAVMLTLGPQVYARFFVRVGAVLGAGHVTFLAMKDAADKGGDLRMGGQDAILMYNRQSDDATLPNLGPAGVADSIALAAGAWTCVEFHIDETAGTIDTWVNGAEVAGLVENGTPTADVSSQWLAPGAWKPMLADFRLGWESYSGQTMTLWFDDVALASKRIGCGN